MIQALHAVQCTVIYNKDNIINQIKLNIFSITDTIHSMKPSPHATVTLTDIEGIHFCDVAD